MSERGEQAPQHIAPVGHGQGCDAGFYQRGDVIGLVFQMITLTLCRKQRGQGLGMEREVGQEKLGNQVETAALVWVSNGGGRKQGAGSAYI